MYDIVFLSRLIPAEIEHEVNQKSVNLMEGAAIAWQRHIVQGIEENNKRLLKLINSLPVHAYPGGYSDAFIRESTFAHTEGAEDLNIGFCNIKFIKRIAQNKPILNALEAWAKTNNGARKVLIAYTMYPEFMIAIKKMKRKYPQIITIAIVVDLPKLIASSRNRVSFLSAIYEDWSKYLSVKNSKYVDGYVVITQQMAKAISENKPYRVIEEICTEEFPLVNNKNSNKVKVIYAGLLFVKFGVIKLLDAFSLIDDDEFELLLCGVGEVEEVIKERALKDNRIHFLGQLKREELLEMMSTCNVIVNPRENVGEFTKYSFPSKNLEALSSGIPFIGYKLDGIPDEYDEYINYPTDCTVEALAKEIYRVGKTDADKAIKKAEQAKTWVHINKNCTTQGNKILELVEYLESESETHN